MERYQSLTHILTTARDRDREIRFIDGEKDERDVSFADLWNRAVSLLGSLQTRGMRAGDELIIFSHVGQYPLDGDDSREAFNAKCLRLEHFGHATDIDSF